MSIISFYKTDDSNALYKRFASLACSYVDQPEIASTPVAQIPLENLFRLFEMYRYDAFVDENRRGVLALDSFNEELTPSMHQISWHTDIEKALSTAINNTFVQHSKEEAIDELEGVLQHLANQSNLTADKQVHAKQFFKSFITELG